ncbi:MAG: C-GCAxxG-C-C family protein [Candidatus Marinimicrobia bacterium]|nr:C-GCAxxG-C-C family protein [Candidatus Neomarinimicrobiota bacterium]
MKQHGYQCGMIWGSVLAAGAQAYKVHGSGPEAETRAVQAAQKLVDTFQADNDEINCYEITEIDKSSSITHSQFLPRVTCKSVPAATGVFHLSYTTDPGGF